VVLPIDRIQAVEQCHMTLGVVTPIAHQAAYDGPVLLLHEGIIILATDPPAGESDLLGFAVAQQLVVDELGAIV